MQAPSPWAPPRLLGALPAQLLGLAAAFALLLVLGWDNDGLWFDPDSARHALSGLYVADLLREGLGDPLGFTLGYFQRYPAITPGAYPPLFYLLEGLGFLLLPAGPGWPRALVLGFVLMLAAYTLAWARRWIAPAAGWAAVLLLLLQGTQVQATAVLLNLPALALGWGALYHLRRRQEGGGRGQVLAFLGLAAASLLTHYAAVLLLPVALALALGGRDRRIGRTVLPMLLAGGLLLLGIHALLPGWLPRFLPSADSLAQALPQTYDALRRLVGLPMLLVAVLGLLLAARDPRWRSEAGRLALLLAVTVVVMLPLPARDLRYMLMVLPLLSLAAVLGPLAWAAAPQRSRLARGLAVLALPAAVLLTQGVQPFNLTRVAGFERVTAHLAQVGPEDTVLYAGGYRSTMTFYLRVGDPGWQRRLIAGEHFLNRTTAVRGFLRITEPVADDAEGLLQYLRSHCGCRWIAVEVRDEGDLTPAERLLRSVLLKPPFEPVARFPIDSPFSPRVDLYRNTEPIVPAAPQPLRFPFFTDRSFPAVPPIRHRDPP
ncbi:hypothetical protein JI742_02080 [Piscinibacter sp. Jin2]|uniref:Glycosyltransferase RgtA/B/C/D-like domain-containing protein n=1 Tax=Aquariibacter lacus TaxID=2801332 RepID=A0A9X1BPQ2_9BURK|nr:hypothetical protein [Piscinibacter lacus]MBL0718666.1 hypothetical protein [Piscinibacter lacus]